MERRSFLKLAGGACTSALVGSDVSLAGHRDQAATDDAVSLDLGLLQNRNQNRSTVVCQNGIVCSSQPLASIAGVDILRAAGNAVDAAVCASAMLSLVEPMMCGPGGGLFAIVWNAKDLISKEYAKERVKLIDPKRSARKVKPGRLRGSSDTIYLTTADKDGNTVSLIQSIYYPWGSGFVPDGMGFCLQNRGQLFSLNPNHLNKLEPHKRPFHTIIPAFVTKDGEPVFSFGVMGGSFQPQGQAQVLMNIIDFGMSPQQAGEQARARHFESSQPTGSKMVGGGSVGFEQGVPGDIKLKLGLMGHKVRPEAGVFGGYQGIWTEPNPRRYFGASDPRKDGCAVGY